MIFSAISLALKSIMSDQKPVSKRPSRKTAKKTDGGVSDDSVRSRSLSASGRTLSRPETSLDVAKSSGMDRPFLDSNIRKSKLLTSSDGEDFADPIAVRLKNRRARANKLKKDRELAARKAKDLSEALGSDPYETDDDVGNDSDQHGEAVFSENSTQSDAYKHLQALKAKSLANQLEIEKLEKSIQVENVIANPVPVSTSGSGQPADPATPGTSGVGTQAATAPQGAAVRTLSNLDRKTAREKASSPYQKEKPVKAKKSDPEQEDILEQLSSFLPESGAGSADAPAAPNGLDGIAGAYQADEELDYEGSSQGSVPDDGPGNLTLTEDTAGGTGNTLNNVNNSPGHSVSGDSPASLMARGIYSQTPLTPVPDLNTSVASATGSGVEDATVEEDEPPITDEEDLLAASSPSRSADTVVTEKGEDEEKDQSSKEVKEPEEMEEDKKEEDDSGKEGVKENVDKEEKTEETPPSATFPPGDKSPIDGPNSWEAQSAAADTSGAGSKTTPPVKPPTAKPSIVGKLVDGNGKILSGSTPKSGGSAVILDPGLLETGPGSSKGSEDRKAKEQRRKEEEAKKKREEQEKKKREEEAARARKKGGKKNEEDKPKTLAPDRPDLIFLPDVPPERDVRKGTSGGYVFVSQEQYRADRDFVQMALRDARAQVAMVIFDTMDTKKPTSFLLKFWGATGVSRAKPMNEIIADLFNASREGWPQRYNAFSKLTFGTNEYIAALESLQDLSIRVSRTRAKKKQLAEKEGADKANIMKKGEEKGLNFAGLVRKNPSGSNKHVRFDKAAAGGASGTAPPAGTSGDASGAASGLKPALKPTSKQTTRSLAHKQQQEQPSTSTPTSRTPVLPPAAEPTPQEKLDEIRQNRPEPTPPGPKLPLNVRIGDAKGVKTGGVKDRLSPDRVVAQDYTLIDLLHKQKETHTPTPVEKPDFPPTPPNVTTPDGSAAANVDDSGFDVDSADVSTTDPETLQVFVTKQDTCFSPEYSEGAAPGNANLPPRFDPSVPPPSIPNQNPNPNTSIPQTSTNPDGSIRRRVIIESVLGKSSATPQPLTTNDLPGFRARAEFLVDQKNDSLPRGQNPIRYMVPWVERGKIIVVPADRASGNFFVDSVNDHDLKIKGHSLRAGWNLDLPEAALISLRWESMSDQRSPQVLVECPKKGIARMNGWDIDPNGPKEISFYNSSRDKENANVWFTKVIASRRICQLIQGQQGRLWISGGQATARWRNKPLTPENEVQYDFQ